MEEFKKSFTVCYSGGIDSTYIAYTMGQKYEGEIHLLTLLHGYGQLLPSLSQIHVRELGERLGQDRIKHSYLNTHAILKIVFFITDFFLITPATAVILSGAWAVTWHLIF
jgi:tRNA(Ile)-lysidine synthase TilS/MesJ